MQNCHKWLYAHRPCAILYVPKRYASTLYAGTFYLMIQSRNQHLIQSPFPTPYSYVSPKEPLKVPWESHFVEMFECESLHAHTSSLAGPNSTLIVGTGTTDYSKYLSIHPGMVSRHTSCSNVFTFGIGSPGLSSVARRRAKNQ